MNCGVVCRRSSDPALQTLLGSCVAVAVVLAGDYSSDLTPSLETSMCHRCGLKKTKDKRQKKKKKKGIWLVVSESRAFHDG